MPKKIVSFDCEHSYGAMRPYNHGFYLTCVGVVIDGGPAQVFWFEHKDNAEDWVQNFASVRLIIESADIVIAHNLKHDMTILRHFGISFEKPILYCTMVSEYLLSGQDTKSRTFSLDAVAEHYGIGKKLDKVKALWDQGVETCDIPMELLAEYCVSDCQLALDIYKRQIAHNEFKYIQKVHKLQMEFQLSLSDMELYGFHFSEERARKYVEDYDKLRDEMESEFKELVGEPNLNIGSGSQRSAVLFGGLLKTKYKEWVMKTLKVRPESTYKEMWKNEEHHVEGLGFKPIGKQQDNGYYPTSKEIIGQLACTTADQRKAKQILLEYSVIKKARETLLGKDDKGLLNKIGTDGHVHPNFNMAVTATGRLSSSDPNSQNMPRGSTSPLKMCILPFHDLILQVDLSQIEWRAAMEMAKDNVGLHEINNGIDQHTEACIREDMMNLPLNKDNRNHAKIFNFRMIYGGSPFGFFKDVKMPNFPLYRWKQIVKGFMEKYWRLVEWWEENIQVVYANGGWLRIMTGRKFVFPKNDNYEFNERQIKNYPVQGIAGGDILPMLAVIIRRGMKKMNLKSRMILTVHDSVVFDVKKEELDILIKLINKVLHSLKDYVINYYNINWEANLAGEIEIGPSYGELKEI